MAPKSSTGVLLFVAGLAALAVGGAHFAGLRVRGIGNWTAAGLLGIGVTLLGATRNVRRAAERAAGAPDAVHAFARGDDELEAQIELQAEADRAQLQQMAAQGLDPAQPQRVVLHYTVASDVLAHELAERLQQEFGAAAVVHDAGAAGITTLDLTVEAVPATLAMREQVAARVRLASRYFAEHNGWSVPVSAAPRRPQ